MGELVEFVQVVWIRRLQYFALQKRNSLTPQPHHPLDLQKTYTC